MPPPPDDLPDAAKIAELMTDKDTAQPEEPKPILDPSYENMKILGIIFPILVTTGLILLICIFLRHRKQRILRRQRMLHGMANE